MPAWSPGQVGYFAGSNILGGTIATLAGPTVLQRLAGGYLRLMLIAATIFAALGFAISSAAWAAAGGAVLHDGPFWFFVAGHVVIGCGIGWVTLAAPQLANELHRKERFESGSVVPSVLFAPSIAFGVFVTSLVALLVDPQRMPAPFAPFAFLLVNAMQLIGSAGVAVALFVSRNSLMTDAGLGEGGVLLAIQSMTAQIATDGSSKPVDSPVEALPDAQDSARHSRIGRVRRIAVGVSLAVALQFTGITAVMAFAPNLSAAAGLPPLLGNCLFMLWNALTSLGARPAVRAIGERRLFLVGSTVASVACLLTGIPTIATAHAAADSTARIAADWAVFVGVVIVIAAFETGLGPSFYTLAQTVFPASERRTGTGVTVCAEFATTLAINVGYAPLQSLLSGDAAHGAENASSERVGQGYIFLLFATVGLVLTAVLHRTLRVAQHDVAVDDDFVQSSLSTL